MKKLKFWILITIYVLLMLADGLLTFINTPDLSMEANPLVANLGLGWVALAKVFILESGFETQIFRSTALKSSQIRKDLLRFCLV